MKTTINQILIQLLILALAGFGSVSADDLCQPDCLHCLEQAPLSSCCEQMMESMNGLHGQAGNSAETGDSCFDNNHICPVSAQQGNQDLILQDQQVQIAGGTSSPGSISPAITKHPPKESISRQYPLDSAPLLYIHNCVFLI